MTKEDYAELQRTLAIFEYETDVFLSTHNHSKEETEMLEKVLDSIKTLRISPYYVVKLARLSKTK